MVAPFPMLASVVLIPTPAESEMAIALSEDTAPDAAMEITSWSDTAETETPLLVSVLRVSVKNKSLIFSKVKSSLKSDKASRVSLSPPPKIPLSNGDDV